ncbi:hypothetical protein [Roseomonas chloroacetimidivorans]|uniref:hypothetical protein n=1 Tax=Roseomonas chloroacetimidivorans TaxID=1766656 RepID=UPI003C785E2A
MPPRTITLPAIYLRLNTEVNGAGGEAAFARKHGLTRQEVHEAMKGNRHPSPGMLAAVGVKRAVIYVEDGDWPKPRLAASDAVPGTCACLAMAELSCANPVCPRQPAHLRQIPPPEAA